MDMAAWFGIKSLGIMGKGRLEAFSDGVLAIIITIMVLELRAPSVADLAALRPLAPVFFSYLLSFVFIGIYWNNHHHTLHAVHRVNGPILWANLHLLFWISLIPFVTEWMGLNHFAAWPVALYGVVLFMAAVAYFLFVHALICHHGQGSPLAVAIGSDFKGKISLAIYALAVALSFVYTPLAIGLYVLVAVIWFLPDRRIENVLSAQGK
jgi:uncharacterized membrane protein